MAGAAGMYAAQRADAGTAPSGGPDLAAQVPFHGPHQAGITTPAQDRMHFVALDVTTADRAQLVETLKAWTAAAERMTAGAEAAPGGVVGGGPYGVPQDTGEAFDLPPSGLTITVGFGPSLFDGRFGLAGRRPEGFEDLPAFRGDDLDPAAQAGTCASRPVPTTRRWRCTRSATSCGSASALLPSGGASWASARTSSTSRSQVTARNMFGFKDGTNNLKAEDADALAEHVWVQPGDVPGAGAWMAGGSYLVARRIRMQIEVWDRTTLQEQEQVIGRNKGEGAPLGRRREFDTIDFAAKGADGAPAIPDTAHIRLASAEHLKGIRLLRRGYNFTDGTDGVGHLDAGLFFIAFCRDAARQFVPMQRALAATDALNEYIEHTGSAVFACPPGVRPGEYWGQALFT